MGTLASGTARRVVALVTASLTIWALGVPFTGEARANHPTGTCLDLEPETTPTPNPISDSNQTVATDNLHVITATLRTSPPDPDPPSSQSASCEGAMARVIASNESPVNVDFEVDGVNDPSGDGPDNTPPDLTCTIIVGSSSCQVEYTGTDPGMDEIRGWIDEDGDDNTFDGDGDEPRDQSEEELVDPLGDEPDGTDVVAKTWAGDRLECTPETDVNPTGTGHTVTCTARNSNGDTLQGENVDVEATGVNNPDGNGDPTTPDFQCTTGTNGSCTFTHGPPGQGSTNDPGTTQYRAWIDADGNNATAEADATEGPDAGNAPDEPAGGTNAPGAEAEPDDTDVVTKSWGGASGEPFTLDCDDGTGPDTERETNPSQSGPQSTETYTCTVRDPDGAVVTADTEVKGENESATVNDPQNDGLGHNTPDYTCMTGNDGVCTIAVTQEENQTGTASICFWVFHPNPGGTPGSTQCGSEATGENQSPNPGGPDTGNDLADRVEKTWAARAASGLDLQPETPTNDLGTQHEITATVYDQFGSPFAGTTIVGLEFFDGSPSDDDGNTPASQDDGCTTSNSSTCTITYSQTTTAGTDLMCGWIGSAPTMTGGNTDGMCDDPDADVPAEGRQDSTADNGVPAPGNDSVDVVSKTWETGGALDCEPETRANPTGTSHTVTCTIPGDSGGTNIDAEATGANDPDGNADRTSPDFNCTTNAMGSCTFTHGPGGVGTTNSTGTTTYRAWIDIDGNDATDNSDANEPLDHEDEFEDILPPPAGENPDGTDVVEKTWAASRLDCAPEEDSNPSGTAHAVTCTARNAADALAPDQNIDVEATGANDDDGNTPGSPDYTCTTGAAGTCTFTHPAADSSAAGVTTYRAWVDIDGVDATVEADQTEGRDETVDQGVKGEPDHTDVVEKTWTASRLECTPEQESNPSGSSRQITCTATDAGDDPVEGTEVDVEATGANDPDTGNTPTSPDFFCTTGSNGTCTVTHGPGPNGTGTTNSTGTTVYRAWIDADDDNATTEADAAEGRDESATAGNEAEPDDTDVVEKTWTASRLDCSPETSDGSPGTQHTITCTARDGNNAAVQGVNVDVEATGDNDPDDGNSPASPDFTCTTAADGTCAVQHPAAESTGVGTTTYRAWIDADGNNATTEADGNEGLSESSDPGTKSEPDDTDVVEKNWVAPGLDCSPESDANPTGTGHSVTCTVRDANNQPVSGATIHAEATGANDPDAGNSPTSPDFDCTTGASGSCTFIHGPGGEGTTNSPGTTTYRAWIDEGTGVEADTTEGRDEGATPGTDPEPDDTDVVEKTWGASRLDCEPETDTNPTGTSHVVTCTARDATGGTVTGTNVDVEATGANDPDGNSVLTSPDFTCTTNQNGTCTFTHGPGSGGTGTTNSGGTTTYRAWIDTDGVNSTVEADTTEPRAETTTGEPDGTDVVEKTWSAAGLQCTPETDSNPINTNHTITCTATDAANAPSANSNVDVEATGANDPDGNSVLTSPDFTCTTAANGTCTFTHSSAAGGTDTAGTTVYRAWVDSDGSNATAEADQTEGRDEATTAGAKPEPDDTDVVQKTWTELPTTITMTPEADTAAVGSCNAFTITATDAAAAPVQGVILDVEQIHQAAKNQTADDEPLVSFCTPAAADGPNPSGVSQLAGDLAPPGENPDNFGTAGGETTTGTDAQGKVTIGIRVQPAQGATGNGTVDITAFFESTDNDDPDPSDPKDTSVKTWGASSGRTINCTPKQAENPAGTTHTVTCTVLNASAQPAQGEGVTFAESGQGDLTSPPQQTTDSAGRVQATTTSSAPGTQTITATIASDLTGNEPSDVDECDRAVNDPQGAPAGKCSDQVTKTWTEPGGDIDERCGDPGVICGTDGDDTITGTDDDDSIICGAGNDTVDAKDGDDTVECGDGDDTVVGGSGDDILIGGDGSDTLRGQAGADTVTGDGDEQTQSQGGLAQEHDDALQGGPGEDILVGGIGKDALRGGSGADVLEGGDDNDFLSGGDDNDVLRGQGGFDTLKGNSGDDTLIGGSGDDILQGGGGADVMRGGSGADLLKGFTGKDTLRGGEDDDVLRAGGGRDTLRGGKGADILNGGRGNDSCRGGPGKDIQKNC